MGNKTDRDKKSEVEGEKERACANGYTYDEEMNRLLEASRERAFDRYNFGSDFCERRYDGKGCLVWFVTLSDPLEDGSQEIGILVNGIPCSFLAKLRGETRPLRGWIAMARLLRFDRDMRIEADLISDFDWPKRGSRIERAREDDREETEDEENESE